MEAFEGWLRVLKKNRDYKRICRDHAIQEYETANDLVRDLEENEANLKKCSFTKTQK